MFIFCGSRNVLGAFYFAVVAHLPAAIASYLSIQLERPVRRPALAIYVVNVACETIYRKLVDEGLWKPIPKGEVLLFTGAIGSLLYFYRKNGYGQPDPVSLGLRYLLGPENVSRKPLQSSVSPPASDIPMTTVLKTAFEEDVVKGLTTDSNTSEVNDSQQQLHTKRCSHQTNCINYALIALARNFTLGYSAHFMASLVMRPKGLLRNPLGALRTAFTDPSNVQFGAFIGSFTAIYKATCCLLRAYNQTGHEQPPWHSVS